MARRLSDPTVLSFTLNARLYTLWVPGNAARRLQIARELLQVALVAGDRELALQSRQWRVADLMEIGDLAAADREIARHASEAHKLRAPLYLWFAAAWKAMRALLDGRLGDVEIEANEARMIGHRAEPENAEMTFASQMFWLRREQGRLDEFANLLLARSAEGTFSAAHRCGLALVCAETGRFDEARAALKLLYENGMEEILRDTGGLPALATAAEACAIVGDTHVAKGLYSLLRPFAGRNIVTGMGISLLGSASRHLGLLTTTLRRWEEAERYFSEALAMHSRMGIRPLISRTQHDYARMLSARGAAGDRDKALKLLDAASITAEALGLKTLAAQVLTLRQRIGTVPSADTRTSVDVVADAVAEEKPDLRTQASPDGTVTILFSDIEGFTSMTERLGDGRAHSLLQIHNRLIREEVFRYGGLEVKAQGDGFMVAFASARRALLCAIAVQRTLARNVPQDREEAIRVRIGLHTGKAIKEGADFFGTTVNLAARITAQGRGGEILVSGALKELTESAGDLRFGSPRAVELKGVTGTRTVFPVAWAGEPEPGCDSSIAGSSTLPR
jgi:class 3 adenylate cyclase